MVKGYVYTLEAAISLLLIVSVAVFLYKPAPQSGPDLVETAWSCLNDVNNQGLLRQYVDSDNRDALISALGGCLPKTVGFNVAYCTAPQCPAQTPEGRSVYSADYLLEGSQAKLVSIYVWSLI